MDTSKPHVTSSGDSVAFTVTVEFAKRECVVTKEALQKLAQMSTDTDDLMEIYSTFEANINGVARRMVAAGVQGTPLQISEKNFQPRGIN